MSYPFEILDTGVRSASENMQIDAKLLEDLDPKGPAILHFYDWEVDSITYGYFVKPEELLHLDQVKKQEIQIARRPTGGGIVFHMWDLAFSLLIPSSHPNFSMNPLENYAFVNEKVLQAASSFLTEKNKLYLTSRDFDAPSLCNRFCMAKPTKYDVILENKKIAGSAQRKTKNGYLHQGTIAMKMPDQDRLQTLVHPEVCKAIQNHTFPLLKEDEDLLRGQKALKLELQNHLVEYVTKT